MDQRKEAAGTGAAAAPTGYRVRPDGTTGKSMYFDLASLGWDAAFAAVYARMARSDRRPGRVTRIDEGLCVVLSAEGTGRAGLGGGLLVLGGRSLSALPCTGDWVVLRSWPDRRTTVEAVLPRRNQVGPAAGGQGRRGRASAANLDLLAVVESIEPHPDRGRLERLLASAARSGARPLVLISKTHLIKTRERAARLAVVTGWVRSLVPGCEVIPVSARLGTGVDLLRGMISSGATLGMLGAPGAGMSAIVRALLGETVPLVRRSRRRGARVSRRSTSGPTLTVLPGGGAVVDLVPADLGLVAAA